MDRFEGGGFTPSDSPDPIDATSVPPPYPHQGEPEAKEKQKPEPLNPGKLSEIDPLNEVKTFQERYPKLREVITELKQMKKKEFDDHVGEFNSPHLKKINALAEKTVEAMLLKAVVEVWDKETLFTEFKKRMALYRDVCTKESMPKEVWISLLKTGAELIHGKAQPIPGFSENPHLADRINLRKIMNIKAELTAINEEYVHSESPSWFDAATGDPMMYLASKIPYVGNEELLAMFDEYAEYIDVCLVMGNSGTCDNLEDLEDMNPPYQKYFREVILPLERAFWIDYYTNLGVVGDFTMPQIKNSYIKRMDTVMQG